MEALGVMHGDALEINNVIQEKPYKPIDSMEVVLSHSYGLSSSQLENAYSIVQLTHLHYNDVYLSKDSRLLLSLVSICVFGDVRSIEPAEGGVLTPSSTIHFTMKSVTPLPTIFHPPSSVSSYLHALQYSTNQSDIGNEAIRVHGLMVRTLYKFLCPGCWRSWKWEIQFIEVFLQSTPFFSVPFL